jgi:hypothetical protein
LNTGRDSLLLQLSVTKTLHYLSPPSSTYIDLEAQWLAERDISSNQELQYIESSQILFL